MNFGTIWALIKETFSEWMEDKAPRLAAALSYYTMFSLAPLLIIAIAIAGLMFDTAVAQEQIHAQIKGLVGVEGADAIKEMIEHSGDWGDSIIATLIGVATLLFGATGVFGQLQDSLNTIWEVAPKPNRTWMETIKVRFVPFTMVLGIGFLLLVSLIVSTALASLEQFMQGLLPGMELLGQIFNFAISFGVITLLFAMMYKVLPDVKIAWRDVWIGAAATALLFTIGKFLIGLYLGKSSFSSTYGAAGSLIVILLWVYYSSQILFLGAEFTQVYAKRYGSRIQPAENAVAVTEQMRAQEGIPHTKELERQVGGQALTGSTTASGANPRRSAGAVAGFLLGLLIGGWRLVKKH